MKDQLDNYEFEKVVEKMRDADYAPAGDYQKTLLEEAKKMLTEVIINIKPER